MFRSIRARIIAAAVGCLFVALLLNTVINYLVTRQDNLQTQRDMLVSSGSSHSLAIGDWVGNKMTAITSLQNVALSDDPVPLFKQLAQAAGFSNVYVGYATKTAKFSDPTGVPADYDPTVRPWYQQVLTTDAPAVTAPYVDAGTGKLVVTFAVPVKENGTLKAVVAGDVVMDSVVANVREIHPTPASSGLLINSDGSVIAASDPALTLKPFTEAISGADLATLKKGEVSAGLLNGVEKTFAATPIAGTQWLLIVALDQHDASTGMRLMLKASALSLVILILLGGAVVHFTIARLLKRLSEIRDAMHAIANGTNDLSQRLPEKGQDEVAEIAHAFNAFSDKLSVVMAQLRDASASVKTAAQEIAAGNHDLSGRTEQAASSLRETASAVEQITASVAQSTESAADANAQASRATEAASRGGNVVSQAITTMQSIESASAKIGDITSVIDGIAFLRHFAHFRIVEHHLRRFNIFLNLLPGGKATRNIAQLRILARQGAKTLLIGNGRGIAEQSLNCHPVRASVAMCGVSDNSCLQCQINSLKPLNPNFWHRRMIVAVETNVACASSRTVILPTSSGCSVR
jgi:methyl-accepting chemotaxis protein